MNTILQSVPILWLLQELRVFLPQALATESAFVVVNRAQRDPTRR